MKADPNRQRNQYPTYANAHSSPPETMDAYGPALLLSLCCGTTVHGEIAGAGHLGRSPAIMPGAVLSSPP
jgi:hypothetical protein